MASVRFLGEVLWTDSKLYGEAKAEFAKLDAQFGMNDHKAIKYGTAYRKLRPVDTVALHEKTLSFLKEHLVQPFDGKTVVITHHASSPQSIPPQYRNDKLTPGYASDLEYLMGTHINLWLHGHVHNFNDYNVNGTRVFSNPRGYHYKGALSSENSDFKSDFVVEL